MIKTKKKNIFLIKFFQQIFQINSSDFIEEKLSENFMYKS